MANSATVGTAVIKLSFDGKNVKAELNGVAKDLEATGKATGSKWGSTWAVAAGNMIAQGVSKVANMISNTMSGAIARLDTINNFPRVMTSLGYSAEEAGGSIDVLKERLLGLPTSLQDGVIGVQKLAATMGNLNKGTVNATSLGMALNDMFLAGGQGVAGASRALEQYNQMLANGKVDMMSWRTVNEVASGQLRQLSETMLGAGNNAMDLYNALQQGTVTFDELNEAIVRLDKEGGDGFANFEEQARAATDGVATQIENITNTMNSLVASALNGNWEDVNGYINQLAQRISKLAPTLIQGFVGGFNTLMKAMPEIIKSLLPSIIQGVKDLIMAVYDYLPDFINMLVEATPMVVDAFMQLMQAVMESIPTVLPQLIEALTNLITTIAIQLTRPDFLTMILQAGITMMLELVKAIPQILTALIGALPQIITNIISFLLDPNNLMMIVEAAVQLFMGLVMAVPQILGALVGAFGDLVGSLWEHIKQMFGEFAGNFGEFIGGIFKNAINGVLQFIENIINGPIDIINGFIGLINDAFGFIGVNLGRIDRISLPRLATGGIALSATTAIIGEQGKEAVLPLENNTDNWAGLLASTLVEQMEEDNLRGGGDIIQYNTIEINNEMDAQDIGRVLMQSIRRAV